MNSAAVEEAGVRRDHRHFRSQYRSIRRKASNPSIIQLATIAGKLRIPIFTLLGVDVPGGKKLSGLKMTAHIALVVAGSFKKAG